MFAGLLRGFTCLTHEKILNLDPKSATYATDQRKLEEEMVRTLHCRRINYMRRSGSSSNRRGLVVVIDVVLVVAVEVIILVVVEEVVVIKVVVFILVVCFSDTFLL